MPTYIQAAFVTGNSTGADGAAFSSVVTSGNLLAVTIVWVSTAVTLDAVTDPQGNTYTLLDNPSAESGLAGAIAWAVAGVTSTNRVFAHFSTTTQFGVGAHELDGATVNIAAPINARDFKRSVGSTTTDGVTTDAFTPTVDGCYIFGTDFYVTAGLTTSSGTGYTERHDHAGVYFGKTEDSTQVTAGSTVVTFTSVPTAGVIHSVWGVAIEPAAGGGGTSYRSRRTLMGIGR